MSVAIRHRDIDRSSLREPPLHYLTVAYQPEDWVAVLAKCYATGASLQRVAPVSWFLRSNVQSWLRALNAHHFELYVSINVIAPGRRSRRRQSDRRRPPCLPRHRSGCRQLPVVARSPV
jgi:hypothetical protein